MLNYLERLEETDTIIKGRSTNYLYSMAAILIKYNDYIKYIGNNVKNLDKIQKLSNSRIEINDHYGYYIGDGNEVYITYNVFDNWNEKTIEEFIIPSYIFDESFIEKDLESFISQMIRSNLVLESYVIDSKLLSLPLPITME